MRIGASLDLQFEESTEEFVRSIDDLGLSHVEIRQGYLDTHPDPPDARRLRELKEAYDLSYTFHAPHIGCTPANLTEGLRQATATQINKTIDMAAAVGAGAVVVHAGSTRNAYPDRVQDHARSQAVRTLRECATHAEEVGITLCIENQRETESKYRFSATPERLVSLLRDVDDGLEHLGVTLDVGHAKASGIDYADFVNVLGDRIVVAHLHDNDGTGDHHEPVPAYESIAADIGADFTVLEMKSFDDIRRCVRGAR